MASEATLRPPPPSRSLPLCVVWFLAMLLRRLCESVGPRRGRRHAPLPSVRRPPRAAMRPPEPSSPHPRRAVSGEGVSPMKGRPSQRAAAALQAAMPHYPLPGDTWSPRRYEAHPRSAGFAAWFGRGVGGARSVGCGGCGGAAGCLPASLSRERVRGNGDQRLAVVEYRSGGRPAGDASRRGGHCRVGWSGLVWWLPRHRPLTASANRQ